MRARANGRKFGITRVVNVKAPYFENFIMWPNLAKLANFAIFSKKVVISETVRDSVSSGKRVFLCFLKKLSCKP